MSTGPKSKANTFDPARRRLIGSAAAAGTVAALAAASRANAAPLVNIGSALSTLRTGSVTHLISLDGIHAGVLAAADGGFPYLETGPYQVVPDEKEPRRFVTSGRVQPLEVAFGVGMTAAWYQAITRGVTYAGANSLLGAEMLQVSAASGQRIARMQFQDAAVTQMILPALNAASGTDALTFQATLQAANALYQPESGTFNLPYSGAARRLLSNGFRLRIQNAEEATLRASGIDAITIKVLRPAPAAQSDTREEREKVAPPPPLTIDVSNLVFRTQLNRAQSLFQWFEHFRQQPTPDLMRPGILEYVDIQRNVVMGTVSFERLGPLRVTTRQSPETVELEAEMYCEGVSINLAPMAV